MKRKGQRQQGKGSLDLVEEAVHLLRAAPVATLASYYVGALPFVLGLLYFWADMSRSPFAHQHLAGGSLGLAGLFLWMKLWQVVFARRLRAALAGAQAARLGLGRWGCILATQAVLQPTGFFVLPLALVLTLPFGWAQAFYQNLSALADSETADVRALCRKALRQAALWPGQNHFVQAILAGFGFCVFLNWAMAGFALPFLAKMLFGVESVFTRSPLSMLNTTFFAAVASLTYLCVDPLQKAVYVLRCFYGESLQSGEDLKAELRQAGLGTERLAACLVALVVMTAVCQGTDDPKSETRNPKSERSPKSEVRSPEGQNLLGVPSDFGLRTSFGFRTSGFGFLMPLAAADPTSQPSSASISPPELDRAIQEVVQQRKYTWRMPRERVVEEESAGNGVIARFVQRVGKLFEQWLETLGKWLEKVLGWLESWLRRLFHNRRPVAPSDSGYRWILAQEILIGLLIVAAVAGLALLIHRVWRERQRRNAPIASEPIQPAPDLTDENVAADQLPEDGWTRLARELVERGELRLALRAFYLASLAHLAQRNLISLAKFKSNRDYERELGRRGHAFPDLLALFGENVLVFDRSWYGLHEVNRDLVSEFAAKVERIRGGAV